MAESEVQVQIALAGLRDSTYMSVEHAAGALSVSTTTLRHCVKGGKSCSETQEWRCALTRQEKKALVKWISISLATGNPVRHPFIHKMAEKL